MVETQNEQSIERALDMLRGIFAAVRAAEPAWLELDLTVGQIKGLFFLAHHGPMTIGQVAEGLHIGTPWASVLVDRLVDLGLVERTEDPADRRRTLARLTPRGEELVVQAKEGGRERLRQGMCRLSADDLAALLRGLEALRAATKSPHSQC
ncbi:MAG: MarR family transcriptional regulator [Dehalococcoidales bacterium]|nr:MarR family transcriptional regulator [Dehalococcoidales bacterium]